MQFDNFALKSNALAFASRSKAKTKPQRRILASPSTRTLPIGERKWTDVEPEVLFASSITQCQNNWVLFFVMVIYLEKMMERLNSRDQKIVFGTNLSDLNIGLLNWKSTMAKGGGNKKRFHFVLTHQDKKFFISELVQGHSVRNPIDPSLLDKVLIPNDYFEYIYHIGCAINLHSIMYSGLIPGEQILSTRQTVFFTSVDPMNKEQKDPDEIDLNAPRLAWYKQKLWKETLKHGVLGWHHTCSKERV